MPSKALVLIPCCSQKRGLPPGEAPVPRVLPLTGVDALRGRLWEVLRGQSNPPPGPWIAPDEPAAPAYQLYRGVPYRLLGEHWRQLLGGGAIELLIVSAAYGLVLPTEILTEYDLTMGQKLDSGGRVFHFWQQQGLAEVLREYVRSREISHVWSLLPDGALSNTQYQRVFNGFWRRPEGAKCRWVKAYNADGRSAGSGSGDCRGRWLSAVLQKEPGLLTAGDEHMPDAEELVPGFTMRFEPC